MPALICGTCGVQHADAAEPLRACRVCEEGRLHGGPHCPRWTTLEALDARLRARVELQEPGLVGIGTAPGFALGQRALLWQGRSGNLLWNCVPLTSRVHDAVADLGGVDVVALSHPHFQSTAIEWAEAFGARVLVHGDDAHWMMRAHRNTACWVGDRAEPMPGVTLVRTGGHCTGSSVCHLSSAANDRGALLTGDAVRVTADRHRVGFMRSPPGPEPLSTALGRRVVRTLDGLEFDRLYGGWWERAVPEGSGCVSHGGTVSRLVASDGADERA